MSHQQWKTIGQKEFDRLTAAGYSPSQIRNLMRAVEGKLLDAKFNAEEMRQARLIYETLRFEFQNGAALLIVQSAHRAASTADRRSKTQRNDAEEMNKESMNS